MAILCELYFMLLCLVCMFCMLFASNISMPSAFIATNWFVVVSNVHFLLYCICSDLISCALIRFYSFILIGPMLILCYWCYHQNKSFLPELLFFGGVSYNVQRFTIISTFFPSLVSMWLKAVISSVLVGDGMCHCFFLLRFLFLFRLLTLFADSEKGLLEEHFPDTKNDSCAFAITGPDISRFPLGHFPLMFTISHMRTSGPEARTYTPFPQRVTRFLLDPKLSWGPNLNKNSSSHLGSVWLCCRHGLGGFPRTYSHILDADILCHSHHKKIFNLPTVRYIGCLPHQFVKGGKINLVHIQWQQD